MFFLWQFKCKSFHDIDWKLIVWRANISNYLMNFQFWEQFSLNFRGASDQHLI
jgi:hypothetical protein